MKHLLESAETFEAYAVIDCCNHLLKKLLSAIEESKNPLYRMIDDVTGFSKHQNKERIENAIDLVNQIIDAKKIIEANYDKETEYLKKLNKLQNTIAF